MLFKTLIFSVVLSFLSNFFGAQSYKSLNKGVWSAHLKLKETIKLPFKLEISGRKKNPVFTIHNAEEKIVLSTIKKINDSLQIDFPNFHSYIRFAIHSKNKIAGSWFNLNKGNNYKIPFEASLESKNICIQSTNLDLSGKWKTLFSAGTADEEIALGVFKSYLPTSKLTGTFLTETGDYRFLEGQIFEDKLFLSCFDGSHAFFFEATYKNGELMGNFYSGKTYKTTWTSQKDENFEMKNPDSLTYLVKKDDFTFKLKDLKGNDFIYPNKQFTNKPTIIQIMGSWCPNCLDETRFLKEMYEKYHSDGLEIISVAYETPSSFEEQVQKVNLLKTRLNLDFTFVIGGQANKTLSSEHFSMLNEIISYPTAIFINKQGEVVKIHTGFNGPGTGEIYTTYKIETENFIKELLK